MENNQPTEIFKNPILNKLTRTNSMLVISTYLLISLAIYIYGFVKIDNISTTLKIALLPLGLLFFTFVEYIVHRYLYHSGDNYLDEKNWQYKIHGVHHNTPRDKHYLAMPLILALMVAGILFCILYLLLMNKIYFFFPGFLAGYAGYLYIHYIIHTQSPPKNRFKFLWQHHNLHHYKYDNKAYGVSSHLWDIVFGTMPPKQKNN